MGDLETEKMGKQRNRKTRAKDELSVALGVAWYRKEQWGRLLEISEDRDRLEETYEAWEANAKASLPKLRKKDVIPRKVDIDVEELLRWCQSEGRVVDASARVIFTAEKLREMIETKRTP
jgi:hypothetical protein